MESKIPGCEASFGCANGEKCFSNVQLDNSADRIIILNNGDNAVDILVCELSKGERHPKLIEDKIINTSEHIVNCFKSSDFEINRFKCCYVGQYESIYKGVMKKKTPTIKIPNFNRKNIMIKRVNCESSFYEVM